MTNKFIAALIAGTVLTTSLVAAAPAEAQWRRYGGYYRGGYGHGWRGPGAGAIVGGALLGLGVGALLTAPYYAPPPRVVYAPPPPVYPYPYAYPPPGYYAPY